MKLLKNGIITKEELICGAVTKHRHSEEALFGATVGICPLRTVAVKNRDSEKAL